MDCTFLEKISLLVDDKLVTAEVIDVRNHLADCGVCRQAEREFLVLREQIKSIPVRRDAAARKVLTDILRTGRRPSARANRQVFTPVRLAAASATLLVIFAATIFLYTGFSHKSWEVARLDGAPKIGAKNFAGNGRLKIGEWLETDAASRAKIKVADIGSVEVEPESRIRLIETNSKEHRLEFERGFISATINAPPRLFFVNTPSATVIDYGCAYTLNVDEAGDTVLFVTEGWVSLNLNGRESLVPASAYAKSRKGAGPGTPYFEDASGIFIDALAKFDFENGNSQAIDTILKESRGRDSLSLWYLLERAASEADRAHIFDRLISFVPLPEGVTREGVLALNREMLDDWKETIDVTSVGNSFNSENHNSNNPSRLVSVGKMTAPRAGHTATRLADGRVLIVGGMQKEKTVLASAEIYDPLTKKFIPIGNMNVARVGHTATVLPSGDVLIAGGMDANGTSQGSAEIYHPATGVFSPIDNLNFARVNHQATTLGDGRILITGGSDSNHNALSSAEIYDAEKGVFLQIGGMTAPRQFHTATLLADGSVLIVGGNTGVSSPETTLSSAEIYNSSTQKFIAVGNMTEKRFSHAAIKLSDGRVLITGGSTGRDWKDRTRNAEIYDPRSKTFAKTGEMSLPRFNHQAATLLLADNRVLIASAGARLEIFDATSGTFSSTVGNVGTGRILSTATLLSGGAVLIVGGNNFDYPPTASAWLYSP